jgi:hypothetical protein
MARLERLSFSERLRVIRPLYRLARCVEEADDPWRCIECDLPSQVLGTGSVHDFRWYLEGESAVPASSFEDVCSFLLGCTYVRDAELFRVPDFWQHPLTFEQIRKGDCEDHALWAWRRLRELGYRAHLVTGAGDREEVPRLGHAWVIFHAEGGVYLLETTAKARERMVHPLDALRHEYRPYVSVDERFRMFVYSGLEQYLFNRGEDGIEPPPDPSLPILDAGTLG